jgi:hypothetical protein
MVHFPSNAPFCFSIDNCILLLLGSFTLFDGFKGVISTNAPARVGELNNKLITWTEGDLGIIWNAAMGVCSKPYAVGWWLL